MAREAAEPWAASHAPPEVELPPCTPGALREILGGGEGAADRCERILAASSRMRGAIDVSIAEGLHALTRGGRLERLAYHLDDYATEVLDVEKRTAQALAKLGGALGTRPLLREALRSGRVKLRAAQTVLAVATGEAEAHWVERAARLTVRELEAEVRRGGAPAAEDEAWLRLRTHLPPDEREVLDVGLELAGEVLPGSSQLERMEALAQEYLAEFPEDVTDDDPPDGAFRPIGPGDEARRATLEEETDRWSVLPDVEDVPAPDVRFEESDTAAEVDAKIRRLACLRTGWEALLGWCARVVQTSGIHGLLGFATFRHYVEERLGLPARAVEQRAALEKRLWSSPALREARRQKVSYEKLRLLAKLPDGEIAAWTPRAHALTVTALRRKLEGETERQMRASRTFAVSLPRRIAALVSAAMETVRRRVGERLPHARCLAIMACHFIETWKGSARRKSRAERIRERDLGRCKVPGCSHRATQTHHLEYRSHGGSDDGSNQIGLCAFHHLRCIHGGYLRVVGEAPDGLRWFRAGEPWNGPLPVEGA